MWKRRGDKVKARAGRRASVLVKRGERHCGGGGGGVAASEKMEE